ncbi:MAG: AmmeMemoRadiSam system protein B [Armatimonadota bacterium]|nr:AmmeMemoRadiSam system protein B [Armatimonadota bacterium]
MALPRLRPALDAYPVRLNGRDLIAVRDPEGVAEKPVLLSPQTFFVALLLDGTRDVLDVQAEYARRSGGTLLFSWDLQRIVEDLDRHGLLESETLRARREAIDREFRASPVRAPFHAGTAYPAEAGALRRILAEYLAGVAQDELANLEPRGIVAPHIDLARGGWCYGWAYAALARRLPQTCFLLGVAHSAPPAPVVLTTKPFVTPLGAIPVDHEAVAQLQDRLGDLTVHEVIHRTEHSLEFQVLFLQAIGQDRPPAIVPLLVSPLEQWVPAGESPRRVDVVERVIQALRDVATARSGASAVVAAVDFSHVGPRFGDAEPPSVALAARTSARDREVLEAIILGDAEAFWASVTAGGNPQRIDALSAVYVTLRVLEPVRGRLLRYGTAEDPAGGIVSFASLALL